MLNSIPLPRTSPVAFLAGSSCFGLMQIFSNQRMTMDAMSCCRKFNGYGRTAKGICFGGNSFNMGWVNANSIAAQVVYLQPSRDWPHVVFMRKSMRHNRSLLIAIPHLTIAITGQAARPFPTRRPIVEASGGHQKHSQKSFSW